MLSKVESLVAPQEDAVFKKALEIAATPYDEAKEGPIGFPDYNGSDSTTYWNGHPTGVGRRERPTGICKNALDLVGNTPMVRLQQIEKLLGLECELVAKCEYFSAGGSTKDRIALRMIEAAEQSGRLTPGQSVIIEPTSGNTGIGLCLAAAIKGYRCIITMPLKMSGEKLNTMKRLGALILRTPTEAAWNDTNSHIALALRLQKQLPDAHVLDQYLNVSNPMAHFENTGEEIVAQTEGKLDYAFMSTGTGGTMTGTGRKLKEKIPGVKIIAIDPKGSILAVPENLNDDGRGVGYQVEGIGYDFIPTVLDRSVADEWIKSGDREAFNCARLLIRYEGLLCGGSSGSALAGFLQWAEGHKDEIKGKRCMILLPDAVKNYMSKYLDDAWMQEHGFLAQ